MEPFNPAQTASVLDEVLKSAATRTADPYALLQRLALVVADLLTVIEDQQEELLDLRPYLTRPAKGEVRALV